MKLGVEPLCYPHLSKLKEISNAAVQFEYIVNGIDFDPGNFC